MFDARRFLKDNFQNAGGIVAHCRAGGMEPPTEAAATKWIDRSSLTGEWLAKLLLALERKHRKPVSVAPYMEASE